MKFDDPENEPGIFILPTGNSGFLALLACYNVSSKAHHNVATEPSINSWGGSTDTNANGARGQGGAVFRKYRRFGKNTVRRFSGWTQKILRGDFSEFGVEVCTLKLVLTALNVYYLVFFSFQSPQKLFLLLFSGSLWPNFTMAKLQISKSDRERQRKNSNSTIRRKYGSFQVSTAKTRTNFFL